MPRLFLLVLAAVFLQLLSVCGQDESLSERDKETRRLAWIMATSLPEDVESPLKVLIGEDEPVDVEIMKRQLGKPVEVNGEGFLHVVNPATDKDGKPFYERYVTVKVPDGVKKALVILSPVPGLPAPQKFRARVIDMDKFQGGDALFVNLTNLEIGVVLGEQRKGLKPGGLEMVDLGKFDGSRNATVSYHYRIPGGNDWKLISASTTVLRSNRREILVFSYDEDLGQVDYHGISFEGED